MDIVINICNDIGSSTMTILDICTKHKIGHQTWYIWLSQYPEIEEMYRAAQRIRADLLAEQTIIIADDDHDDALHFKNKTVVNREFVDRSKVRIMARQWLASKLNAQKYSEKVEHLGTGKELRTITHVQIINPNQTALPFIEIDEDSEPPEDNG